MCRSEEEKGNIVIGEAVLTLLDDYIDISADTIIEKLKHMLKAETEEARRKIISDAIQQSYLSPVRAVYGANLHYKVEPKTAQMIHGKA